VAEAELVLGVVPDRTEIHPTAIVHSRAQIGEGTTIGPYASIGANVRIGANCRIGSSAVIDGWTEIGDDTEIYPFASIGLIPQDLKFRGEETRLVIGRRNIFREFVTINRGTRGGGGVTSIGDRNVFMAYVARRARLPCRQRRHLGPHGRRPRHRSRTSPTSAPARRSISSAG
jgi:UDP-N-acetylglucosamine acyltransferase